MLRATKMNRVVRIPDEKQREYENLGYTITDMDGKTLYKPEDKQETIEKLKAENEALKKENEELKAAAQPAQEAQAKEETATQDKPKAAAKASNRKTAKSTE